MENTAEQWKDRAKRADSQEKNREKRTCIGQMEIT